MGRQRKGVLAAAAVGLAGLFFTLLPASTASAHGAYTYPESRTYACYQDARQDSGALDPSNPACQAALDQGGQYAYYNWFGNLISDIGDAQAGEEHFHSSISDGELCGPSADFDAFNMARTDWPTTEIQSGATVEFSWQAWAAHPGWFYQYVTVPGWDPSQPLGWDDLELFNTADHPPLNGNAPEGSYNWSATVPERSGQHIIYTIWERSDSPESFFSCSDVNFTGSGSGGDPDTQAPSAPGTPSASNVTASSVDLSWGASSDNVGVTEYVVSDGSGQQVASTSGTSVTVDGLSADTQYTFSVAASDAAGNTSAQSSTVTVTTASSGGGEPPGGSGQCEVDYSVANEWSNGFSGDVTITNTGDSAIDGWTLEWTFPGSQTITNGWQGNYSQSGSQVTVESLNWNGTIEPGGSVSTGFNADFSGDNSAPTSFTVNGSSCSTG